MRELVVVSDSGKGRSFRASLLAYATCPSFITGGDVRPIFSMVACSEAESIPFVRNLQCGKKANVVGERIHPTIDFLKSADYAYAGQRHPEGTVWTIYLPSLYRYESGMVDPDGVRFALLPREMWLSPVDEQTARRIADKYAPERDQWHRETKYTQKEDADRLSAARYVTRVAPLFCAGYLDRRTRCPLIPDPVFYALVLGALMDAGMAIMDRSESSRAALGRTGILYEEHDVESVGLMPGLVCRARHAQLEPVLAECVREYEAMRRVVSVPMYQMDQKEAA